MPQPAPKYLSPPMVTPEDGPNARVLPDKNGVGKMDGTEVIIGNQLFRRGDWAGWHNRPRPAARPTNTGWPDAQDDGDGTASWPEHPGLGLRGP
jgi:hypothetical protein